MKTSRIETWITTGYTILGTHGDIKIERHARVLSLNKSGFYYYFGTMEGFLKRPLQHHVQLSLEIADEIEQCKTIDPDLLRLIVRHKSFFLVESQLVRGKFAHTGRQVNEAAKIIANKLTLLWRRNSMTAGGSEVNLAYMNIIQSFIYTRIDLDHINYEFLRELLAETEVAFGSKTVLQ